MASGVEVSLRDSSSSELVFIEETAPDAGGR
jgi:hypothetical protein